MATEIGTAQSQFVAEDRSRVVSSDNPDKWVVAALPSFIVVHFGEQEFLALVTYKELMHRHATRLIEIWNVEGDIPCDVLTEDRTELNIGPSADKKMLTMFERAGPLALRNFVGLPDAIAVGTLSELLLVTECSVFTRSLPLVQ